MQIQSYFYKNAGSTAAYLLYSVAVREQNVVFVSIPNMLERLDENGLKRILWDLSSTRRKNSLLFGRKEKEYQD